MFRFIFTLLLVVATVAVGNETKSLLVTPGKIVAAPDLVAPLDDTWKVARGQWDVKNGELVGSELPEEKHAAVLWHLVGLQSAVVECEFRFDGSKVFILGCDGAEHVGRLVITPRGAKIAEDVSGVATGKSGETLAEVKLALEPGQWHKVRYEWTGDQMAASIDGTELRGTHPSLATEKARWWFAVGGKAVAVRNIRVYEGQTP